VVEYITLTVVFKGAALVFPRQGGKVSKLLGNAMPDINDVQEKT